MKISSKKWLGLYLILQSVMLIAVAAVVVFIDPFFHYHKPINNVFYYPLDNSRSQNNGITRNFEYDALITGTSMIANFKTSEANKIFHVNAVKAPYLGCSYKEINDNIKVGIASNPNLKMIIRCLDMDMFYYDKDFLRDGGAPYWEYPAYLNNNNPFDDVKYIYNRDVVFSRCGLMVRNAWQGGPTGITSFDEYQSWTPYKIGKLASAEQSVYNKPTERHHLSDEEKSIIKGNIEQNVTITALENPDIQFYYFFSPYSVAWWGNLYQEGNLIKQIETEQYIIEMILKCENIYLFSFNNFTEITTDLNNYEDIIHYTAWINSDILQYLHDGTGRLTKSNYKKYLEEEYNFYSQFEYNNMFG